MGGGHNVGLRVGRRVRWVVGLSMRMGVQDRARRL